MHPGAELSGAEACDPGKVWLERSCPVEEEEEEWKTAHSANGKPYFYNVRTRETVWQLPYAPPLLDVAPKAAASSTPASSVGTGASPSILSRYGMSPTSFRAEIRVLKRNQYVLSQEMTAIVDPVARQRQAREIAKLEVRLAECGIDI